MNNPLAAKHAYLESLKHQKVVDPTPWEDLLDNQKEIWEKIANAAFAATPAPLYIKMSCHLPGRVHFLQPLEMTLRIDSTGRSIAEELARLNLFILKAFEDAGMPVTAK